MTGMSRSMTSQSAKHACPSHTDVFLTAAFNVRSKRTANRLTRFWWNCKLGRLVRLSDEEQDLLELTREDMSLVLTVLGVLDASPSEFVAV